MNLKRLFMAFVLTVVAFCTQANAQDKVVTGKVTDANGAAISGVTIKVKNGKNLGATNSDGTFSVKVPAGSTLSFSSVGFAAMDMQVPTSGNMSISMKNTNENLNEVVVIGYGSAKKKDLTGSIATVSSKDFVKGAMTTPEQLITGKIAGVSIVNSGGAPGAGAAIRIRGGASVSASNDPLIVIDDVPLDFGGISGVANPLSMINPNDIETFTILKDASSAAIYGSRASNGVILITTKRGKAGKPTFNFSSVFSVYTPASKIDVMSPQQFRDYVNANGTQAFKDQLGTSNTIWQDEIYKTAIGTDNTISMSGAIFKNVPLRASVGYLNQQGILRTGSLKRTTASIAVTPKFLKDHLKVDINVKGTVSDSRFANESAIGAALNENPTRPIYDANNKRYNGYWEFLGGNDRGLKEGGVLNPLGLLNDYYNLSHVERSIGNVKFDYKLHFLPDLRFVVNLGYDVSRGRGTINIADSTGQGFNRYKDANGKFHSGTDNQYLQSRSSYVIDAYVNYTKSTKFGDFDVILGQSYQENETKSYNFQDYTNDRTIVNAKVFPAEFGLGQNRIVGYYSRLRWSYNDKYIISGGYRTDGSSRFVKKKWGNFANASVAWRISKEDFMKNVKFINDLKLRAGMGQTGQQDGIGDYGAQALYQQALTQSSYMFGNNVINVYTPLAYITDPNYTWEKTTMYNYGIDFSMFNNKLTGSIEYYRRETKDLFFPTNQAAQSQFSNIQTKNSGELLNEGFEITLATTLMKKRDFTWDIQANMNYNENTITKVYAEANKAVPGQLTGGISGGVGNTIQIQAVGQNRNAFFTYKQVYDKAGKPVDGLYEDINRDGVINEKDLVIYKKPDPTIFAGLTMNFGYKKWNFGFVARAALDQYIYNNVRSNMGIRRNILNTDNVIAYNGSTEILSTNLTGNGDKSIKSNYWIENASFFRVDNINLGYNFGKVFKNTANLRISANVQNAFVVTKYTGLDPEVFGGIDNTIYARPRVFVIGVNLDF